MLIRAGALATMDDAGLLRGDLAIAVEAGRIVAVGPTKQAGARLPAGHVELHLGNSILLPGLINAHTHLELSHCTPIDRPASFVDWITSLPRRTGRAEPDFESRVIAAAVAGARESLRFGVTCVGDITAYPHWTRPALAGLPLRVVSFGEALGLALARPRFEQSLERAIDTAFTGPRMRIGLSPHAPYTVDLPGYRQCVEIAGQRRLPLATHLAETLDEMTFLREQRGAFRDIWERLGSWSDGVETFVGTPIEMAEQIGLLRAGAVLAHVNYLDDNELGILAQGRAAVVFCPRTHAYFGHPPHRWRDLRARGVCVAVGTDSRASSPDLNPVDDLRLLWAQRDAGLSAVELWKMLTIDSARTLHFNESVGSLAIGKLADVVAFPILDESDPLAGILSEPGVLPTAVFVEGERVP
jgi:cytosine/adenosine deaminase-related metal-dependent hydrolase